ncbi:hypothetical protein BU23DRAFT_561942 [Bimuria novae-zelandiae CBS 107.79]|uniref:Uncharacterized protein n=1 Tax=Bimuria novae-zelandiae CBS 107.79 TaxID=1447943 RepID=A0A6A5UNF5_9PLEO|nr:hypothetical protein BU23DRAFT_561942 [Bimuria novae-zelandiae CBS 107.79]
MLVASIASHGLSSFGLASPLRQRSTRAAPITLSAPPQGCRYTNTNHPISIPPRDRFIGHAAVAGPQPRAWKPVV